MLAIYSISNQKANSGNFKKSIQIIEETIKINKTDKEHTTEKSNESKFYYLKKVVKS
jgi:hypothetical protein